MDDERLHPPTITVHEPAPGQSDSGLLDVAGRKLMVSVEPEKIGFVVFAGK